MRSLPVALAIAVSVAGSDAAADLPDRALTRPPSQAGVPSSASYTEKTITWPSGGGKLDFDYYVDSEEGADQLKFLIDGAPTLAWSGASKAGHVSQSMSAGSHVIRFEYVKDGANDRGLDTAFVDAIIARDNIGIFRRFYFDDRISSTQGWTGGGTGSGFAATARGYARAIRRPISQAFSGYVPSPTSSRAERTFNFSGTGPHQLAFDYSVDSEPNFDFLRVYVDGMVVWQISGNANGTKILDMTAGTHTVMFEYAKDTSVDVGRDLALVDNVRALSNKGTFEQHSFDGRPLGSLPYGWTASGVGSGGFVLAQGTPVAVRAPSLAPMTPPTVDGFIALSEYQNPTIVPLYDVQNARGRNGTALLKTISNQNALYVAARVHSSSVALGSEGGSFTIYFDASRVASLAGVGCGANGATPGTEDRKIVIAYSSSSGQPTYTANQYRGACGNWTAVSVGSDDEWITNVALQEPQEDPGFVHLEAKVELKRRADSYLRDPLIPSAV